ncbi:hypothetical protein F5Y19DRAFT_485740 [Xylariaceae sp. FL1651]|nr:hypothetical protein F5Y19DRAFT_485740 [Xylariaceae sp. FL1651]
MAPIATENPTLAFGMEFELLVRPVGQRLEEVKRYEDWTEQDVETNGNFDKHMNRSTIRKALTDSLNDQGLPAELSEVFSREDRWAIASEELPERTYEFYWGIEIKSPVMRSDDWLHRLDKLFDAICLGGWEIQPGGCSTHIHVSPDQGTRFTWEQLREITKAVYLFDKAITEIMPPQRKYTPFACPITTIHPPELPNLYRNIADNSWAPLFKQIDKDMKDILRFGLQINRHMSWNFCNVDRGIKTMEFRRPPGSGNAHEAKVWAGLALGFISAALLGHCTAFDSWKSHPSVDDLKAFVNDGLQTLGGHCAFVDVNQLVAIPDEVRIPAASNTAT